jgi:hypothetical protein
MLKFPRPSGRMDAPGERGRREFDHSESSQMDDRGLARSLQHPAVGQWLLLGQREGQSRRPARWHRRAGGRHEGPRGRGPPARHRRPHASCARAPSTATRAPTAASSRSR